MLLVGRSLRTRPHYFRHCRPLTAGNRAVNVHHVKFKKPWIRRFATTCLLYGAAFHLWSSLLFLQFDGDIEPDSLESIDTPSKRDVSPPGKDHAIPEQSTFIPLGLPHIQPGALYAPSDAEWGRFVKMAADKQRLRSLREELTAIVWNRASHSVQSVRLLGGPLTVSDSWLVPRFPYRAPPHYEQYGLDISDSQVSWVSKTVDSEQGDRVWEGLLPLAVSSAMIDAFKVLWTRQVGRLREFLHVGGSRHPDNAVISLTETALQLNTDQAADVEFPSFSDWENSGQNSLTENISAKEASPNRGHSHPSVLLSLLQRLPFSNFAPGSDLHHAMLTFKRRLRRSSNLHRPTPKRGVFYLTGPVGLKGPRGSCRMEVCGEYDPASGEWTAVWMHLRDFNLHNQKPLGYRHDP